MSSKKRRIAILATLDTKANEARFVAEVISMRGHDPFVIDTGIAGAPSFAGDVSREKVAAGAGTTAAAIAGLPRAEAMSLAAEGAAEVLGQEFTNGTLDGVIALGGGTGTWIGNAVMQSLPIGFPKLLVSTMGNHDASQDIMVMPSVVDIAGLNGVLRPILTNAANAICGMADTDRHDKADSRKAIALSMFGVTTAGGTIARKLLEDRGYEVMVFHANGSGGRTMERLISEGFINAVLDWSTTELIDELVGGTCSAGPARLEAAGRAGIPQVVVPGAIDVINTSMSDLPRFSGRRHVMHLPTVPLVRTSLEESRDVAKVMAGKLNAAKGPTWVVIPENGFSVHDRAGGAFEDRAADAAFVESLRATLDPAIPVEMVPAHINDATFAEAAVQALLDLLDAGRAANRIS